MPTASAFVGVGTSSPRRGGGSAIVGVSSRSKPPACHSAIRRVNSYSQSTVARYWSAGVASPRIFIPQLTASSSASMNGPPVKLPISSTVRAMCVEYITVK